MRLLIVSNRAPVTAKEHPDGFSYKHSVGGLATGLASYTADLGDTGPIDGSLWIGWPGIMAEGPRRETLEAELREGFGVHPVFLTDEEIERYYLGFCNATLWPLFHYFQSLALTDKETWDCYVEVNRRFLEAVLDVIEPDDLVWVQDYHLMLLPGMIREEVPGASIGYFLHIPFPSYEIFRQLPRTWAESILTGVLGADVVGFHTHDYTQQFLRTVLKILGHDNHLGEIHLDDHTAKVGTFPMGIDFDGFSVAAGRADVIREADSIRADASVRGKMIISIDRLDYTKGITNSLLAYELFLENNPEWLGNVVLAMVVVPSRTDVLEYSKIKNEIDTVVGRVNGRFGDVHWTPILYQYGELPFEELVAMYVAGDVNIVTPKRDGMNLIAKEYLATRLDETGALILSETAGAACELREAYIVNPENVEEIAGSIAHALRAEPDRQAEANRLMRSRIESHDVKAWAHDLIGSVIAVKEAQSAAEARRMTVACRDAILSEFINARNRLILLDYDGTLVPLASTPVEAMPDEELMSLLNDLASDERNTIALISGRDRFTIEALFSAKGIHLVAEHGAWCRMSDADWEADPSIRSDWKPGITEVLERYVKTLPGSLVEEKEYSVAWHYRKADPEAGQEMKRELVYELLDLIANNPLQVVEGSKVVEIRNSGVDKGSAVTNMFSLEDYDFILAMGDDRTDEDMFAALPESAHTIKVGIQGTEARHAVGDQRSARRLLEEIARTTRESAVT